MLNRKEKIEIMKELLDNLGESELWSVHWSYCDVHHYEDDRIFDMCLFDEDYADSSPLTIASAVYNGEFDPNDSYYKYDGYGNLKSGSIWDLVDTEELAKDIVDTENWYDNNEIQEQLEEWEEEEDEEGGDEE